MVDHAVLTEEEYLNLPVFVGRQEFRDGELIELPPAKWAHARLIRKLLILLLRTTRAADVYPEIGFRLRPGRWVIPDLCVAYPDQRIEGGYPQGSPMLAIEVASRGNTPDELQQKVVDYIANGALEVLVIYPASHTMTVYRAGGALTIQPEQDYYCDLIDVTFTPEYRHAD